MFPFSLFLFKGSTSGALGVTINGTCENEIVTKKTLRAKIKTIYAGRVAEFLYYGNEDDVTAGASQDIIDATKAIKEYIKLFGIGDSKSLISSEILWGEQVGSDLQTQMDIQAFAKELYQETVIFLTENKEILEKIAYELTVKQSLNDLEIDDIISRYKI